MSDFKTGARDGFLFSEGGLAANTLLSGIGAGATVVAVSGAILPAIVIGAVGAGIGYLVTNEIRREP